MKIHQIGAGGVGYWLAVALARDGVDVIVYDTDTFEGGLGHMRLPRAAPTTKKIKSLYGFCLVSMGDKLTNLRDELFTGTEVCEGDLVVDCSDMALTLRKPIYELVMANGGRYIRISYDGKNKTVVAAEGLPIIGRPKGGYAEVPNLALSFMAGGIGALVVQKILDGHTGYIDLQISLEDYLKEWSADAENTDNQELPPQSK